MTALARTTMLAFLMALTVAGCAVPTSSGGGSASPSPTTRSPEEGRRPTASTRKVDPAEAERLQRIMVPLVRAMNNPLPLNKVKVGIMDDPAINAANAGGGQFLVTTGLLQKANDEQLTGVLAHEIAHDDLRHVAKAQTLGAGLNIGMIILDQIIPGSGALTPIAGELVVRGYSRREEYAADAHGVEILKRAGQSPDIMERTLAWLMKESGGSSKGGFFSTHPGTGERIEALRKLR
jgi:Zn-dependent protease with chaperone function